jgi:hypothetical protein
MLKIGIVYEGSADKDIVKGIVLKLLPQDDFEIPSDECEIITKTGIIGFVPTYSRKLFTSCGVDLAIFLTDQDVPRTEENRRNVIQSKLNDLGFLERSVVGVADPHIEKWLFADEDIIKLIFNLPGHEALPYSHLSPKERLSTLRGSQKGEKRLDHEAKLEIIRRLTIEKIKDRFPDFRLFADDLVHKFNLLRRVH